MSHESDDRLHQPHDKLFKLGFSDPVTAAAFLREQIPEPLSRAIEWGSMKLLPGSFIDPRFRAHQSDLLFSAPLGGGEVRLFLLFEHQSTEDRWIALRLLRYMVSIWEQCEPDQALPPILPVVLAQNDRAWKIRPDFVSLFELPDGLAGDVRWFLPDFGFRLIQLAQIPFEAIRGTPAGVVVLRTLKAERSGRLLDEIVWDEPLLSLIPRALFEAFVLYLSHADVDSAGLESNLKTIQTPELKETAMTLAQKLRQEGRQEGRREGRLSTLRENVVETLGLRLGPVPAGLRQAVEDVADEEKLRHLLRLAVRSASIEEFSSGL